MPSWLISKTHMNYIYILTPRALAPMYNLYPKFEVYCRLIIGYIHNMLIGLGFENRSELIQTF